MQTILLPATSFFHLRVLIVLLVGTSVFSPAFGQQEELLKNAKEAFRAGKYRQSQGWCRQVVQFYNTNNIAPDTLLGTAYHYYGTSYFKLAKLDSAYYFAQKALASYYSLPDTNLLRIAFSQDLLGGIYTRKGDYKSALSWMQKALAKRLALLGEEHEQVAKSYNNLASSLSSANPQKSLEYSKKALAIRIKLFGKANLKTADSYSGLGYAYSVNDDHRQSILYLEKALAIYQDELGSDHPKLVGLYINIGNTLKRMNDLEGAVNALNEGARITRQRLGEKHSSMTLIYSNMGSVYYLRQEVEKGIQYFQYALRLRLALSGEQHPKTAIYYSQIGVGYRNLNRFEEAIALHRKALGVNKALFGNDNKATAGSHTSLGNTFRSKGDIDSAEVHLIKAYEINRKIYGENHISLASNYHNLSLLFKTKSQYKKAIFYLEKALKIRQEFAGEKVGQSLYLLADLYLLTQDPEQAQRYMERSRKALNYNEQSPMQFSTVSSPQDLQYWLVIKERYFRFKFQNTGLEEYSDSLKTVFEIHVKLRDYQQRNLAAPETNSEQATANYSIYERAMSHLFDRQNPEEYPAIFELAEKSKFRLLSESFRESRASQLARIPQELLREKQELSDQVFLLEQALAEATKDSNSLSHELFLRKKQQDELNYLFNQKYPDYVRLSRNHQVDQLEKVQKDLPQNHTLLEYFVGDEYVFLMVISRQRFEVKRIPLDFPLEQWVQNMRSGISDYWTSPEESDSLFLHYKQSYLKAADSLYQKLVAPVANQLSQQLIIVPDDVLYLIPFEALLSKSAGVETPFSQLHYWVLNHEITYAFSASLHHRLQSNPTTPALQGLAAFAPSFSDTAYSNNKERTGLNQLRSLAANVAECQSILAIWDGKLYTDTLASKAQFLAAAENAQILHLATHAKAFPHKGRHSFIAFSNAPGADRAQSQLFVNELYALHLSTDMVVLSACETGMGEVQRGEGIIGLSRGMLSAGAKSIVSSLWSINDATTKAFMTLFYEELKQPISKSEALRKAKLSFIEQEKTAAPYFWSAYTLTGNAKPLSQKSNSTTAFFAALALLFIFIGVFWQKRRQASKR